MFINDEKLYLKSVYKLTVSTEFDIIQNFKEKFEELNEILFMNFLQLKEQIKKIGFTNTPGDELKIEVHYNIYDSINTIKKYI